MITEDDKAKAIAQLEASVPPEQVALDLGIPEPLVQEWMKKLDPKNMIAIKSNIHAVEQVIVGNVSEVDTHTLKHTLRQSAMELARQSRQPGDSGDMVHAKAISLCADAVSKLYSSIVIPEQDTIDQDDKDVIDMQQNGSVFGVELKD